MIDDLVGIPISDLIRTLRERHGLSQRELADKLAATSNNDGMSRRHVSRWEQGDRIPTPHWREWMAVVLETPVGRLNRAAAVSQFLRTAPEDAHDWVEYRRTVNSTLTHRIDQASL
jgi:transcriptional regulator with XRE-family HTH domain